MLYIQLFRRIFSRNGNKAGGKRKFKLANGETKEYPTGEAYIEIGGEGATSVVAFIPEGATPLLGVIALEALGLQVDPSTGELKPLELLLL